MMKTVLLGFWIAILFLVYTIYVQDTVVVKQAKFIREVMQDPSCQAGK